MNRALLGLAIFFLCTPVFSADYKTVREARAEAARQLRTKNYAAAQEPLEAALKLTPETDEKERVEIYRALMMPYRQLPEQDKMTEAVEYIQEHSDSQGERSLVARDFVSFLHQRGKTDLTVAHYEARLKEVPRDPTALAVLSLIYERLRNDQKERGAELAAELKQLNLDRAIAKAARLEAVADQNATAAASNWKDIAKAWLEAQNHERAKAAVERSLKAAPEARSTLLTMYWRDGLGDVYLELGDRDAALKAYQAAVDAAPSPPLKTPLQAKIDKLNAAP